MPAILGFEGLADFAWLEFIHGILKFRHHLTGTDPTEIAAFRRRARVVGAGLGQFRKVRTVDDAFAQARQFFAGLITWQNGTGFDQDMSGRVSQTL